MKTHNDYKIWKFWLWTALHTYFQITCWPVMSVLNVFRNVTQINDVAIISWLNNKAFINSGTIKLFTFLEDFHLFAFWQTLFLPCLSFETEQTWKNLSEYVFLLSFSYSFLYFIQITLKIAILTWTLFLEANVK